MSDLDAIFETGGAAWHPQPDDNPDNHGFYRAWHGVAAVCQHLDVDPWDYHTIVHQALCWAGGVDGGRCTWPTIVRECQRQADGWEVPKRPTRPWSSDSLPPYREERAYQIFTTQFKQQYPGKRLNSRFAREKWGAVKDQADALARAEYQQTVDAYLQREQKREKAYQKQIDEWQNRCDTITKNRAFVARLVADEHPRKDKDHDTHHLWRAFS